MYIQLHPFIGFVNILTIYKLWIKETSLVVLDIIVLIILKSVRSSALQFKFKLKCRNFIARRFEKRTIKLSHFLTELDLAQNSLKLRLVDTGQKPARDIGVGLTESRLKNLEDERHSVTSANMKPVQITHSTEDQKHLNENTNVKLKDNTVIVQPK